MSQTITNPFTEKISEWGEGEWLACAGHVDKAAFVREVEEYARTEWGYTDADLDAWYEWSVNGVLHTYASPAADREWDDDEPYITFRNEGLWPVTMVPMQ